MRPEFIAVGDVMLDVTVAAEAPPPGTRVHGGLAVAPGGSAVTAALWAAAEGAESTVVGRVGDDAPGTLVRSAVEERGARALLAIDGVLPTGTMLALGPPDRRAIVADRGANAALSAADLPEALDADAVLVSGYVLFHADSEGAARAALQRSTAAWVAVDVGSEHLVAERGRDAVFEATREASVILANEREALALTGRGAEDAAEWLARRYRVACVKRGARGAVAALDGTLTSCDGASVGDGDTIGAGDAFAAGLLVSLARGMPVASALRAACRVAALAVSSRLPKITAVAGRAAGGEAGRCS